jgi:riboflavin synthase
MIMFSGIIQATAPVLSVAWRGSCLQVRIRKPRKWTFVRGASVAVDGVCSTVINSTPTSFAIEYVPETLAKTTALTLAKGRLVNLERSLVFGERIEGHFVQGHVEGRGRVVSRLETGRARELSIALPRSLARAAPLKGSVAVNGVSLTIARKRGALVTIALIPHTLSHTNLERLDVGDAVNIETDMLLRGAVARLPRGGRVTRNAEKRIRTNKKRS